MALFEDIRTFLSDARQNFIRNQSDEETLSLSDARTNPQAKAYLDGTYATIDSASLLIPASRLSEGFGDRVINSMSENGASLTRQFSDLPEDFFDPDPAKVQMRREKYAQMVADTAALGRDEVELKARQIEENSDRSFPTVNPNDPKIFRVVVANPEQQYNQITPELAALARNTVQNTLSGKAPQTLAERQVAAIMEENPLPDAQEKNPSRQAQEQYQPIPPSSVEPMNRNEAFNHMQQAEDHNRMVEEQKAKEAQNPILNSFIVMDATMDMVAAPSHTIGNKSAPTRGRS